MVAARQKNGAFLHSIARAVLVSQEAKLCRECDPCHSVLQSCIYSSKRLQAHQHVRRPYRLLSVNFCVSGSQLKSGQRRQMRRRLRKTLRRRCRPAAAEHAYTAPPKSVGPQKALSRLSSEWRLRSVPFWFRGGHACCENTHGASPHFVSSLVAHDKNHGGVTYGCLHVKRRNYLE